MREKRRNMEEKNISCASHEAVAASQQKHGLTRRSFLKWTGAAATVPALGQLVACAPQAKMADTGSDDAPAPALEDEGEWKPYRCFRLYCSASCINYALVKDGQVVRVKTDDRNPDSEDMPQQRGCLRGQAKMNHVYGPDRLKYPMKRKNWEPGGDPAKINGELRGKDEWVRISWDEALDIIADELTRIIGAYGNEAVMRAGLYPNPVDGSWRIAGRMRRQLPGRMGLSLLHDDGLSEFGGLLRCLLVQRSP